MTTTFTFNCKKVPLSLQKQRPSQLNSVFELEKEVIIKKKIGKPSQGLFVFLD